MTKKSVAYSAFVFILLFGLMISSNSYKRVGLFWTDILGIFLMPWLTAAAGSFFIYSLLFWYEKTRHGETCKVDKEL